MGGREEREWPFADTQDLITATILLAGTVMSVLWKKSQTE